ncbi:glucosaminidase domain-containing protein [Bacteroides ovatus]|uniref:glucosaminidase domain-containing protein n=1 Tax=Bacteroides ovatus TaxID=28116 RepID=UPI00233F027B|nr:glucosaminidase domain-containing protein [Bacteroides ovatus]MDC2748224.1 glucosaminidase domain-containing protein [Bacteroides ovatus]MDC2758748.1 glucosaminidase domain-containing protein [Bacteroides ovatus]
MHNTILSSLMLLLLPITASAQFYTITKDSDLMPDSGKETMQTAAKEDDTISNIVQSVRNDTLHINTPIKEKNKGKGQKGNKRTSLKSELPELTIPNLYAEIIRNGIRHPKIVLAQAILETGWFTSPVCRNKHNLFGLTNPRTGKYFEFDHWTESVRAYYTKVQYKFKGGNYLLWLRKIGYAEDPNYVCSIISILKTL